MGRTCAGGLVDGLALCQQDGVQSPVTLLGRDEANRAMTVLSVVPVHESGHPRPGLLEAGEGFAGILRTVLQGTKQRFGIGVVIADCWSTERGRPTQLTPRGQHGGERKSVGWGKSRRK